MDNMRQFQALEQMQAYLRDFAPVIGQYFALLLAQGFTREEALQLVLQAQRAILFGM